MKRLLSRLLPVVAGLLVAGAAQAQSPATTNLAVSANVAANCTVTTLPLAFGAYDVLTGATVDGAGSVSVRCTKGTTYGVALSLGANFAGAQRRMSNGTDNLNYDLYSDNTYTTAWADLAGIVSTSRAAVPYPVNGRILANQDVGNGAYADTVVVTVNYL